MLSLLLLSGLFTGCGSKQTGEDGTYHAYYLNKEATRIIEEPYTPKAADTDTEGMIEEFLKVIAQTPEKVECRKLLRSNVEVTGYNLDGGQLSITFSEAYAQMEVSEEMKQEYVKIRKWNHDIENHLLSLEYLTRTRKADEAERYCSSILLNSSKLEEQSSACTPVSQEDSV